MKRVAPRVRNAGWGAALACSAALVGCADSGNQDDVYTYQADAVDFGAYGTFSVVSKDAYPNLPGLPDAPSAPVDLPDDIQKGLKSTEAAVREQMTMLGLEEVDADADPDLFVLDYAATNDNTGVYWECIPNWYWWGWYDWWTPCDWVPVSVDYTVGSILVLVADPNASGSDPAHQVVFAGLAQGVLDGTGDVNQRIADDVATMFSKWPTSE